MSLSSLLTYRGMTLELVIWSLFIGIVIGALSIWYLKKILGTLVRALLKDGADSTDNAKTLRELGLKSSVFFRIALREKSTYRKIVHIAETGQPAADNNKRKKLNIDSWKFFIPEKTKYRADTLYNTKGSSILTALLAVLAFFIMVLFLFWIIPNFIQMIENLVNQFSFNN